MKIARFRKKIVIKSYESPECPALRENETILFESRPRGRGFYLLGIIILFIPPFVWCLLAFWFGYRRSKYNKIFATEERVVTIWRNLIGSGYYVEEIPRKTFCDIHWLSNPINPLRRMLLGESVLGFGYRDDDGTIFYQKRSIWGDSKFVKQLVPYFRSQDDLRVSVDVITSTAPEQ